MTLAFGLRLELDPRIQIPGFGHAEQAIGEYEASAGRPPTRVMLNPAGVASRWDALQTTPRRMRELRNGDQLLLSVDFAASAGYLLQASGIGRVLITPDGEELLCDPDPTSADWSAILTAQALPLAATLRGLEVFHAAGVVVDGRAWLLAGEPGAGKSSLAAAFVRRGAGLLSDDAVAVELRDGVLWAHPGHSALHLRTAEHERLSDAEQAALGAPRLLAGRQMYVSPTSSAAAPFAGLLLLERSAAEPAVQQLEQIDPFTLLAATFNLSVRTPERLIRQLDVASALASGGGVYRLRVQPGIDATRLAEILHERFASL